MVGRPFIIWARIQMKIFYMRAGTDVTACSSLANNSRPTCKGISPPLKQQTLNGDIILIHAGVDPRRKDRFYDHLDELLIWLQSRGYRCVRLDELL